MLCLPKKVHAESYVGPQGVFFNAHLYFLRFQRHERTGWSKTCAVRAESCPFWDLRIHLESLNTALFGCSQLVQYVARNISAAGAQIKMRGSHARAPEVSSVAELGGSAGPCWLAKGRRDTVGAAEPRQRVDPRCIAELAAPL